MNPKNDEQVLALRRIDAAFEDFNQMLDLSGALESPAFMRASYWLRLLIARALGEHDRAKAAEASLQELNSCIEGLNLHTPEGWIAGATNLLRGDPPGTALHDAAYRGYLVLLDDQLVCIPVPAGGGTTITTEDGYPIAGQDADASLWSGEFNCWEAHDPATDRDVLLQPQFVNLTFVEQS